MMWPYGYGGGFEWFWMAIGMLLFWGGVVALAFWVVRRLSTQKPGGDAALDVLRRRLAAGEITPEEFERTRKALSA